jgi:drug/metabolite transporter (DMT)-like permease
LLPAARFGRANAIISALLRGNLRDQFYSDVFHFGEAQDATRQVALGYICLASCFGWMFGAIASLIAYPAHPESCLLAVLAAALNWYLFGYIRRRKDPRPALDYMVPVYLLIVVAVQYRHTGFVAPMVATMPLVAGVTAMYQRRQMHPVSLALGIMVVVFCLFSATGMIGEPPTADPRSRSIMTFITLLASTFGLAGISWMSTLSRD